MESEGNFEDFGKAIESDPLQVLLAKWRRDAFISRLRRLPDVVDVIESGSLARETYIGPVHDIDLIVVFDPSALPGYSKDARGPEALKSADAALGHLQKQLVQQLEPGSPAQYDQPGEAGHGEPLLGETRDTKVRTHVVQCHGGSTGPFHDIIPSAPPVDVMPAVREGNHLRIPERGTGWIDVDPQSFMREIAQRQREWRYFTTVIKAVKAWAELNELNMKSIAVEAMVILYCPRPRLFETLTVGEAVAQFFEAAAKDKIRKLSDPAGRCGEIDRKFRYDRLREELKEAARVARQAVVAEQAWETRFQTMRDAVPPNVFWRQLFGRDFPGAKVRIWRAPSWESWVDDHPSATTGADDWRTGPPRPDGREGPAGRGPDDPDRDAGGVTPQPSGPGEGPRRPGGSGGHWAGVFGAGAAASVPLTFG